MSVRRCYWSVERCLHNYEGSRSFVCVLAPVGAGAVITMSPTAVIPRASAGDTATRAQRCKQQVIWRYILRLLTARTETNANPFCARRERERRPLPGLFAAALLFFLAINSSRGEFGLNKYVRSGPRRVHSCEFVSHKS